MLEAGLSMVGWALCAGTAFVATAEPLSNSWAWIHNKYRGVGRRMARLGIGLGVGVASIVVASQVMERGPVAPFSYTAPNTPTGSMFVIDTSTVYFLGSSFVGSGDDTHDSTQFQIDTLLGGNFSAPIADSITGPQIRDTIGANAKMTANVSYQARWRYKGDNLKSNQWSAWSAPDTFVNQLFQGVVYASFDWGTTTGTSNSAIRDGGGATPLTANSTPHVLEVKSTSGAGRDYPSTNYLQVEDGAAAFGSAAAYLSTPAVNDTVGVRYYFRLVQSAATTDSHGIYFDDDWSGGTNWGPQALGFYIESTSSGGTFKFQVSADNTQGSRYYPPTALVLNKQTTYRIEALYIRAGTNTYQLRARIYNISGTLLYSDAAGDFGTLNSTTFTVTGAGAASLRGIVVGVEGDQEGTGAYSEQAAFAICDTWCGVYPISGVEN